MLSLVIVLVIFDLLNNTEYFEVEETDKIDIKDIIFDYTKPNEINNILKDQSIKIDNLENMIRIVQKYKTNDKQKRANLVYPTIPLINSCIMLDSDGNISDPIPKISSTDDIYSNSDNPYYHSLGKDHEIYNDLL